MRRHGALSSNGGGDVHVRHAEAPRSIAGACHDRRTEPTGPVAFENGAASSAYGREGHAEGEAPCLPRICAAPQDRTEGESCPSDQQFPDHSSRVGSRLPAAERLDGPDGPSADERKYAQQPHAKPGSGLVVHPEFRRLVPRRPYQQEAERHARTDANRTTEQGPEPGRQPSARRDVSRGCVGANSPKRWRLKRLILGPNGIGLKTRSQNDKHGRKENNDAARGACISGVEQPDR